MVTAGTYQKRRILNSSERLEFFNQLLFQLATKYGWKLQAWSVLANHYHFIAMSPKESETAESLQTMIKELHRGSAREWNRQENCSGRRVWYNYWDTRITYEKSYYPRLKYVHNNPAHHGVVEHSSNYKWCSRSWFERNASSAFRKTIDSFKTDRLNVLDDF